MENISAKEARKIADFIGHLNLADALNVVMYRICLTAREGYYSTTFYEDFMNPEVKEHLIKEGYSIDKVDPKYYKVSW